MCLILMGANACLKSEWFTNNQIEKFTTSFYGVSEATSITLWDTCMKGALKGETQLQNQIGTFGRLTNIMNVATESAVYHMIDPNAVGKDISWQEEWAQGLKENIDLSKKRFEELYAKKNDNGANLNCQ